MFKKSRISKILLSILTVAVTSIANINANIVTTHAELKENNTAILRENVKDTTMVDIEKVEFEKTVNIAIPTDTNAKTYEDGRLITDTTSQAYSWISQCQYDERGHYMLENKYYAVAMGNYFDEVGSKYKISLNTGRTLYVVKCDVKQDIHTTNRMIDGSGAMIEFIINTDVATSYYGLNPNGYVLGGNFNNHESFQGNIIKVEQIIE